MNKPLATKVRSFKSQNMPVARSTIAIQGARQQNLKNISLELPRDRLIVVTGLSGSGKSSLAFDTIYAEGQRRFMESLSSYAKRFISQVSKPDFDFIFGLSPVISIEQNTVENNPRSTVGTMTDISSYLNLLFATIGQPHCPRTGEYTPSKRASQVLESILSLPAGTEIELLAPAFKVYGEDLNFLFTEIRKQGCRQVIIDGKLFDISDEVYVDESRVREMDIIVDRFVVVPGIAQQLKAAIANALLVGDRLISVRIVNCESSEAITKFYDNFGSKTHHFVYVDISPDFFAFNNPESACRTCGGLGTDKQAHPELIVRDPRRSIRDGCFAKEAFKYNPDTWDGRIMYSLSQHLEFDLDIAWKDLPETIQNALLYGIDGRFKLQQPPEAKVPLGDNEGKELGIQGIARRIERSYRHYRQNGDANSNIETWLNKVMVEHICPDCQGTRLRQTRLLFTINEKNIHEFGQFNFDELRAFLDTIEPTGKGADAGRQILKGIKARLDLLLGIGLDYLNFNRRSGTLSGGESQRIRLSTQIGSGLMG